MGKFHFANQLDIMDCGPACLKMIAGYYGKEFTLDFFRTITWLNREGVSILSLSEAAQTIGLKTIACKLEFDDLISQRPLPAILHWNQDHFVVLYKIKRNGRLLIADPAAGMITIKKKDFIEAWIGNNNRGTILLFEPTPAFYRNINVEKKSGGYRFLFGYVFPHKRHLVQLGIGMVAASFISLAFPFLTQILVDFGVGDKDVHILYIVLLSQLFLFAGSVMIDIIRSWLLLHINTRISLNIISDFLIKLLKLPISFFESKAVGDISQRIIDHHRIENFLTGATLHSLFSMINIIVFSCILAFYNWKILMVFLVLSAMAILWVFLFQKKRKELDYLRFSRNKENQDKLYEMITGMQEIKLYSAEKSKRWEWEKLQVKYFNLNTSSLVLEQYQHSGYIFLSHLKNIIISFIAANDAINGRITLGALLSISYIIGQTNSPIDQLINFIKGAQDAKLSVDRLQEIHHKKDEENIDSKRLKHGIVHADIFIRSLHFQYEGPSSPFVLKSINITIPKGKITAIVGASGSGKTTLMKLLLGFYKPTIGDIHIGDHNLQNISPSWWRTQCGTVMQDGYIFYDTIANNIALDGNAINETAIENAVATANLEEFIESLPLGFATKIGNSGVGISGGQRQRILIARSVYKDPNYLFFDEATSSLDANNELYIMNKLNNFFEGKTVVIIAHRLSTVKKADQILVLEKGQIVEVGNHEMLTKCKGRYFDLVRNQLELCQ